MSTTTVSLSNSKGYWQLLVNGNDFYVKGIAGDYFAVNANEGSLPYLSNYFINSGANAIRVYNVSGNLTVMKQVADEALALVDGQTSPNGEPLMVIMGLAVKYVDKATAISNNKALINYIIGKSNADRILCWAIGNEVYDQDHVDAINTIASFIKSTKVTNKLVRPIMTVSNYLNTDPHTNSDPTKKFPDIDIWGVNSYYGKYDSGHALTGYLDQLGTQASNSKMSLPWIVTEFGSYNGSGGGLIPGQTYGTQPEYVLQLNSTDNAQNYADCWNNYIAKYEAAKSQPYGNLGGVVLDWMPPHNSGIVYAFFKCFTYNRGDNFLSPYIPTAQMSAGGSNRLESVDTMTNLWGGTITGACPSIVAGSEPQGLSIEANGSSIMMTESSAGTAVSTGTSITAEVTVTNPGSGNLSFLWFLIGGNQGVPGASDFWKRIIWATPGPSGFFGYSKTSVELESKMSYYLSDGVTQKTTPNPFVDIVSNKSSTSGSNTTNTMVFQLKSQPSLNVPGANPSISNGTGSWPNALYQLVVIVKNDDGAAVATGAFPVQ
ncbi:MAG: hypothetical protein MI974_28015 [Chitinophagales bacterium]|nr:hypothetical protein [Chitinophagales bacterium]